MYVNDDISISAFQYGNSLPSVISAAKLLRLRSGERDELSDRISPFAPEARIPLQCELNDAYFGTTMWKRNERERFRVRCVNDAYERLRERLPLRDNDRRISKVDTLHLAIRYIKHLEAALHSIDHWSHCQCFNSFRTESEQYAERKRKFTRKKHADSDSDV